LNTARSSLGGAGTNTLGIVFGGGTPTVTTATESWNGTSWINVENMISAGGVNGCGTQSLALATTSPGATFEWYEDGKITEVISTS